MSRRWRVSAPGWRKNAALFTCPPSSISKKSRLLIPLESQIKPHLPMPTHCYYEICLRNHAIWMSHLRKDFRPFEAKLTPTQAHAPSRKRDTCSFVQFDSYSRY